MTLWKPVRPVVWGAFRATARTYLVLSQRRYRHVFILGHIRSGSTLLSHILASHPDFAGAGETHIFYQTEADLPKLVTKTCEFLHRPIIRKTYMVDQINHDYVSDDVLRSELVYRCVILIREPRSTLKSMITLFKCSEQDALDRYTDRLAALTRYGLVLKERAMLVEYDDLVDRTDSTLAGLTRFFDLESPLKSNYATHRMTARIPGVGDPSDNIKSGQVIRTSGHDDIAISNTALSSGMAAFCKCRDQLHLIAEAIDHAEFRPDEASGLRSPSDRAQDRSKRMRT
jgi:hypothetical protein